MKALLLALGSAAAAAPASAQPASYATDPTHTSVTIEFMPGGVATARARFTQVAGRVTIDRAAGSGSAEITVETPSGATGSPALDRRLGLDGAARFTAGRFEFDGQRLVRVAGTLELQGRRAPLLLQAQRFDCYTSPLFRREVCGGDFEASIDPAAFGIAWPTGPLRALVQVEAIRQ